VFFNIGSTKTEEALFYVMRAEGSEGKGSIFSDIFNVKKIEAPPPPLLQVPTNSLIQK